MNYIPRKIDSALADWKADCAHKPLLLRGARQTGKTSAVRNLAKSFSHYIEVNFESNKSIHAIFNGNIDIPKIIQEFELQYGTPIIPGKTLIFLDEIQACPNAISALRYFYEEMQSLHIIAAGSLLEFVFEELSDFGVGRIRNLFVYPLSFREFVSALGDDFSYDRTLTSACSGELPEVAHNKMLNYLKSFLIVGGMPAAVSKYVQTKSYLAAQQEQDDILLALKEDFGKYKTRLAPDILRRTLTLVAEQTGQKFTYSDTQGGIKYIQAKKAVELLERAKIIVSTLCTHATGLPLGGDINPKGDKFMLFDTGLYLRECGLTAADWILDTNEKFVNRGRLAEMYVGLELKKASSPLRNNQLYYWRRTDKRSTAEVDYIVQYEDNIVPLEVKSGRSHNAPSYRTLMSERGFAYGIKTSADTLQVSGNTYLIPLYLIGEYETLLQHLSRH